MTGAELLVALKGLGMTREAFAERFCLDRTTVYRWTAGARAVPPWVPPALDLLDREFTR
jgi:transcriptional regulator with XRE-family HTH domain